MVQNIGEAPRGHFAVVPEALPPLGKRSFGIRVEGDELSTVVTTPDGSPRAGWLLWVDPDRGELQQPGALVAMWTRRTGLQAGRLEQGPEGLAVVTAEARFPCTEADLRGPVVRIERPSFEPRRLRLPGALAPEVRT